MHALRRDARGATLRDPDTGFANVDGPTPSWLGTIGYFVLAEQIGTAVYRIDGQKMDPGFDRAFVHFGPTPVARQERRALRSLRNALAHDYGLVSRGREDKKGKVTGRYLYRLMPRLNPLVRLGPPWNLKWYADPVKEATHIGVVDLANYVENMVDRVVREHEKGNVETDLPGGIEEMGARYLFSAIL